jgi:hypothetical protein
MDPAVLQETVDYVALRRLQSAYADVVTRRAWPELAELFLPDAEVTIDKRVGDPLRLQGPVAVGDFIANAIADFSFFEFVILNTTIDIDGDRAGTRMYMLEIRQDAATRRRTNAFGLYRDEHCKVDGRWWFAGRRYQSLARSPIDETLPGLDVFGIPAR